jgi:tol-pal system-associated acyl-CoA thioesterase
MTPNPSPSRDFVWPARVYWEDTDAGGVVYYANYLKFFERARTEWLRALGIEQQRLAEQQRLLFVVGSAQLRYLASARLDDALLVSVAPQRIGGASLDLLQEVRLGAAPQAAAFAELPLLTTLQVRVACVSADGMRPTRLPSELLDRLG